MKLTLLEGENSQLATVHINHNYLSFDNLLQWLQKLPGLKLLWKKTFQPTDDYWAELEYRGYIFFIETPYLDYWMHKQEKCPEQIFRELINHLRKYKTSWSREFVVWRDERKKTKDLKID